MCAQLCAEAEAGRTRPGSRRDAQVAAARAAVELCGRLPLALAIAGGIIQLPQAIFRFPRRGCHPDTAAV